MERTKRIVSILARAKSFEHAGRGIMLFFRSTPNAWIHLLFCVGVIFLGFFFQVTITEWMFLTFAIGFVFVSEAFNTAIEIDINLTSPEYHPFAKDTKDVAAGAVLLSVVNALIIGALVFGHYLL